VEQKQPTPNRIQVDRPRWAVAGLAGLVAVGLGWAAFGHRGGTDTPERIEPDTTCPQSQLAGDGEVVLDNATAHVVRDSVSQNASADDPYTPIPPEVMQEIYTSLNGGSTDVNYTGLDGEGRTFVLGLRDTDGTGLCELVMLGNPDGFAEPEQPRIGHF
jgi:hypothetical protein